MITIINPSSRAGGRSAIIAKKYQEILNDLGEENCLLNLLQFTPEMIDAIYYNPCDDTKGFDQLQDIVDRSNKFVFILPEYNASFPGLLKVFIDACRYPDSFQNKKAAMVGISGGTQGSALAMGHLSDILNYFGAHTLALRPRFIRIGDAVKDGELTDPEYVEFLQLQAEQLAAF